MLTLLLASTGALAQSQYFPFFQQEYFFGNAPHARNEALARSGAVLGGSSSGIFYNPATLGTIERGEATFSTSAPFYLLRNADYTFLGLSYRVLEPWAVGVTVHNFALGVSDFTIDLPSGSYETDNPMTTNVAITNAVEIVDGLQLGVNTNLYRWRYLDQLPAAYAFHVDLGALYAVSLPDLPSGGTHELRFGTGFTNVTLTRIRFDDPEGIETVQPFPVVFRGSGAYAARLPITIPGAGEGSLDVLGLVEVQDLLNNGFRTAVRVATEVVAYDVIALRLGAYTQSEDDMGFDNNRSRVNDVTYGFGIQVPLDTITDRRVPLRATVDFASLRPPPLVFSSPRRSNLRTFTFGLRWTEAGDQP